MWQLTRNILHSEVEHAVTMQETVQSTFRNLFLLSGLFCLASALIISSSWDGLRILDLMAVILGVGGLFISANALLKVSNLLGLVVWVVGLMVAILACCWLMQMPELVLLSAILPMVAVITIGEWAGIAVEGLVVGMAWLAGQSYFGHPLPLSQMELIAVSGAFNGLLGWLASRELLRMAVWSMASFEDAHKKLDEVRNRQMELNQAQEDLRLANSELARLTNRLKALEQIAESARQATTEFVANVSHELRTPLNMIIGYADMISRSPKVYGGRLPPSLMTDILAILRNAQHLSSLVNDVLDLSQVEEGRMAISRNWNSLGETLGEALIAVSGLFESKGLFLRSEVAADLPLIFFDETRIRQVMINLLSNAGRFTETGGVVVRCQVVGNEMVIQIEDTGPGIALKDQARVFEPFQQADASIRRRYGGSGLGLPISKQFIVMHGGRMWLESEPGKGTTLSFSLPLDSPALAPEASAGVSRLRSIVPDDETGYHLRTRRSHLPAPAASTRYVVVDPEQTLPHLLANYLPESSVEVLPDLAAAVAVLNHSPAQALILNLPRTGSGPLPPLVNLPFGTPAVTCWLPGKIEAANRLGVVEYLIKPLSHDQLLASLARLGPGIQTVLIVDDEEDELHLFARYLEAEHRYAILQVTNGQRALAMLRSRQPDVMLLDLMMPGIDGFGVLEEKHQDSAIRDIPVIVISSRDPTGDPILSNSFTVTQSGGLTQHNLIACIQAVGRILAPSSLSENKG